MLTIRLLCTEACVENGAVVLPSLGSLLIINKEFVGHFFLQNWTTSECVDTEQASSNSDDMKDETETHLMICFEDEIEAVF